MQNVPVKPGQKKPLASRLLQRIIPLIMIVFIAIGVISFFALRLSGSSSLADSQEFILEDTRNELISELNKFVDEVRDLATSQTAQVFAQTVDRVTAAGISQSDPLYVEFSNALRERPDAVVGIRFISRTGTLCPEVTSPGFPSSACNQNSVNLLANDLELRAALQGVGGEVSISGFRTVEDITEKEYLIIRLSSLVYNPADRGQIYGTVQFDVRADALLGNIINRQAVPGRRWVLINRNGTFLADSTVPDILELYHAMQPDVAAVRTEAQFTILAEALAQVDGFVQGMQIAGVNVLSTGALLNTAVGSNVLVSSDVISLNNAADMPWRLAVVDDEALLLASTNSASWAALLGMTLAGLLVSGAVFLVIREMLKSTNATSDLIRSMISSPDTPVSQPASPETGDEVAQLINAYQNLSQRVRDLNESVETRVRARTRDLEVAARISREAATLHDTDTLLDRTIDLICREFGFYHAQVFLVDDIGMNAVLVRSRGQAGDKLLAQKHKLPVGSASVIGTVTRTGRPIIVNDTQDPRSGPHVANPLLPDTRAEMALPLQISESVIGALDIQSLEPDVFTPDVQRTLQILADQIAVAVDNARLLAQSDRRIEQIDSLNRQLTRTAWQEAEDVLGLADSYQYDLVDVETAPSAVQDEGDIEALSASIAIRGEVIGTIAVSAPTGEFFSENDHVLLRAVADRVALAIENARLFQETQTTLAETATLYQMSRQLNEANTLNDIIQAMIISVMPDAIGGQVLVFDEYPYGTFPEWAEIAAQWAMFHFQNDEHYLEGRRYHVPDYHFFSTLRGDNLTLVSDVEKDVRLDDELRTYFLDMNAGSAVVIPFSVRGAWRGIIFIEFEGSRDFTEREGRLYSALIDQAGVAIDNRLLLSQTEIALSDIERLYAATRIISTAETYTDLVRAITETADDISLKFGLCLFEGALDETGWPTEVRLVAMSEAGQAMAANKVTDFVVSPESPFRRRETAVFDLLHPIDNQSKAIHELLENHDVHFAAAFPLFSAARPLGFFYIGSSEKHELSAEEHDTYRALSGQMSTVLQNRRLYEQTTRALDETQRLYDASRAISAAQDLVGVFVVAAQSLSHNPFFDQFVVLLAAPEPVEDAPYLDVQYSWVRGGQSPHVLQQGLRFAKDNIDETLGASGSIISRLILPMQTRQSRFGVIVCESEESDAFDEQFTRFARGLADQLAVAVENRRLFEEARMEAQRALALAEAGQLSNRLGSDYREGFAEVFARLAHTAGYDRWALMLLDSSGHYLEKVTSYVPGLSADTEYFSLEMETAKNSLVDSVRLRRTLLVNDPSSYPAFVDELPAALEVIGKHLVTPVYIGSLVVGALSVGRTLDSADLDERDEELILTLAAQIGVAIENQRLFIAAQAERETLRSILETMPTGVLVLDAVTRKPIQSNSQLENLLGRTLNMNEEFTAERYQLYRTGAQTLYPEEELPTYSALQIGDTIFSDDLSVIRGDNDRLDMLANAAPIRDASGKVTAIVAAFQDITELRSLETALQDNLRETNSLYRATREISQSGDLDQLLNVVIVQLQTLKASQIYVLMLGDEGMYVARSHPAGKTRFEYPEDVLTAATSQFIRNLNLQRNTLSEEDAMLLLEHGIAGFASVPLRVRARTVPLGWLFVAYDAPHAFSPEEERFLNTLADGASVAIDNQRLFRSTELALQDTAVLYNATTAISRADSLDALARALQMALDSLRPDISAAFIMADTGTRAGLYEMFNYNLDGEPIDFISLILRNNLLVENTYIIDDLSASSSPDNFERDLLALGNIRALATVNLRVKGLPNGRIFVAYNQARRFSSSDSRYLSAVADSASVIIDNVLLFQETQMSLQETNTLYQASRAIANASSAEAILDSLVNYIIQSHINQVFMAMLTGGDWDAPNASVHVAASWQQGEGINLKGITLTADQFPAWRQLSSASVLTVGDAILETSLTPLEQMGIESLNARSFVVIPLRALNRPIGAIWIGSADVYNYTDRERRIYQSIAEQASLSLEATRLLEQTDHRARQLETSANVSQIASSILDLDQLLPKLVDLIRDAFRYDHVQIFLLDDDYNYAELRASTGEAGAQLLNIKHKLQRGSASVIGEVTAKGVPVIALDTADARVIHRPNPYLPNTRSEMALPLIIKGQVVGALDVQSNHPGAFGQDDVTVLTTLGAQISVAIDNARLFDQAKRSADDMNFLFTVTTDAAGADNLDESLQRTAERLRDSLEALSVSIYLPHDRHDDRNNNFKVVSVAALVGDTYPIEEIDEVRVGDPLHMIGILAASKSPLIIDNLDMEGRYVPVAPGAHSAIIMPLVAAENLVGLIAIESSEMAAYDQDTLTLLLTLAGTLSAIIQSAQLLETVQKTNEQLRQLDRLKSDFLANMSHELRTPLNSIIGFSRVILKGIDGPLTEMQEQDLSTIYNSGQHLLGLINDILDQAKIAAGKMDLQYDYFELKTVIDGVRSIGIGLVKDKPVNIHIDMASGLPRAYGDEIRTRQVLLNLVSNAAKFTNEGMITIKVFTQWDDLREQIMLRVDVTDSGIGIAEKDMPLLFEAFQQVDSSLTRTVGGTGLGLPIAKSLVEMQGGNIHVASQVNVGSTFSITIPTEPVARDEEGNPIAPSETNYTVNGNGNFVADAEPTPVSVLATGAMMPVMQAKRQILLIEDNPDMVDVIRRALRSEGFDVMGASIPLEAEAMASGLHPTLIIMDVNFSKGAGWDILAKLKDRDDTFDIPVIVVTLSEDSTRIYQMGAHTYIRRPFVPEDLVKAVNAAEEESSTERILIIDDQPESTRLLKQLLDEHGSYRVFSASNGIEGVSLVARRRPDLVILDLRMPDMDGFAVLQELRNNPETANIPVLVVTADSLNNDERTLLANVNILHKGEISQEDYRRFIADVQSHLDGHNGD